MEENNSNNISDQNLEDKQVEKKSILESIFSKKTGLFIWEIAKIAIIAFVIVAPIRYFLFQPFIVKGKSMEPNFSPGDYLIVDEISYRFTDPKRGDVIVFVWPTDESQRFIKRIIGLPGETVNVANGQVTLTKDEEVILLAEDYLPEGLKTRGNKNITLETDEFFVLGDNREYSYDSRAWGVVPRDNIIGKALFRIFPLADFSQIPNPAY